jgi:hypothetical protein
MSSQPAELTGLTKEYVNTEELAAHLDVAEQTLCHWRCRREGPPFIKVGRRIRYRVSDVEDWLKGRTCQPAVLPQ